MARSLAFYRETLGLEPTFVSDHWSDFDLGGVRLGLHLGSGGPGGFVPTLACHDLPALKESAGSWLQGDYHQTPSGVLITLVDADGNILQVIQPGSRLEDFPH